MRQHRQEITGCEQRVEHLHGVASRDALWSVQTAGAERIVEKALAPEYRVAARPTAR